MTNQTNISPNILQIVSINSLIHEYHTFIPEICRTCLLVKEDISTYCINSNKLNEQEITLRIKLSFCCPELDLRINSNAMLCVKCFETIQMIYEFIHKFNESKSQQHESISLTLPTLQQYLFNSYGCTGKQEIKMEEVDLCDTEIDNLSEFTEIQIQHLQHNSKTNIYIDAREKLFKSSQCYYSCTKKSDLKKHLPIHTRRKSFKCSECDFNCTQKSYLKIHLRVHSGEKPYKCSQCDYSCIRNYSLKRHLQVHTGEKPFRCSQCDYSSIQNSDLKRHLQVHSGEKPFICTQCYYSCRRRNSLKRHFQIHIGEKPFKCSECVYSCMQKSDLKKHYLRIHTGEKVFSV